MSEDLRHTYRRYLSDHPGHPLGPGAPTGRTLRVEFWSGTAWRGESHLEAWSRLVRLDPCAYCGEPAAATVDHIEPKTLPVRGIGSAYSWINLTAACERCNAAKSRQSLLGFLTVRARSRPVQKKVARGLDRLAA